MYTNYAYINPFNCYGLFYAYNIYVNKYLHNIYLFIVIRVVHSIQLILW